MSLKEKMILEINNNLKYYKRHDLNKVSKEELICLYNDHVGNFEKFAMQYLIDIQFEIIELMGDINGTGK